MLGWRQMNQEVMMSANITENPVLVRISADTAEVLHEAADLPE